LHNLGSFAVVARENVALIGDLFCVSVNQPIKLTQLFQAPAASEAKEHSQSSDIQTSDCRLTNWASILFRTLPGLLVLWLLLH
jgi:hypothetical protein